MDVTQNIELVSGATLLAVRAVVIGLAGITVGLVLGGLAKLVWIELKDGD